MVPRSLPLLAAGLLAAAPGAQSPVVIPAGLAAVEGSGASAVPTRYAPNRVQQLYDASLLAGLGTGPIQGLDLRRDGPSAAAFVAHTFYFDVFLGSRGLPGAGRWSRASYAANQGADWTRVAMAARVDLPPEPIPAAPPAPFTVKIPFAAPFPYAAGGHLAIQFDVADSPGGTGSYTWYADAEDYPTGGASGLAARLGKGCPPGLTSAAAAPAIDGQGAFYHYWYSGGGFGTPAVLILGVSDTAWGPFGLPFDLAPLGGPGCKLFVDQVALLAGTTDPSGTNGRFRVDLVPPRDRALAGATFFSQILVLDAAFNAVGVRASEYFKLVLGTYAATAPALLLATYNDVISDVPKFAHDGALVLLLR